MELYEIVKFTLQKIYGDITATNHCVITSTMDKNLVYNMLDTYKANQTENEAYQIRTVRMPEVKEW